MTKTKLMSLCFLTALCSTMGWEANAQFINVPPVMYSGMVKDYMLEPFTKEYGASVYVRGTTGDQSLLAKADTIDPLNGINYALSIPLVSQADLVITAATVGQQIRFDVDDGSLIWGNVSVQTIGNPGCYVLDITLMTDVNTNGVSDEYEALIKALMDTYGISGDYDPNADYNNDGISNYQHYLNGTSPFAGVTPEGGGETDENLTIASLMQLQTQSTDEYFAISFRSIPGKMYSVLSVTNLRTSWGAGDMVDFRTSTENDEQTYFSAEESSTTTLYLRKDTAQTRFYRLRME